MECSERQRHGYLGQARGPALPQYQDRFAKFGGVVTADYYLDSRRVKYANRHGWVTVPPGETITAYGRRAPTAADRVAYNYYTTDPSIDKRLLRLSDVWKYLDFESPLHVVSTIR